VANYDIPENCPHCYTRIVPIQEQNDTPEEPKVQKLWETNETFRTELQEILKARRKYTSAFRMYRPAKSIVMRRFKESIKMSIDHIKFEKKKCKKQLREIPEASHFFKSSNVFVRKLSAFRRKYDIWSLRALNTVEGAPRIPRHMGIGYDGRRLQIRI